MSVEIEPWRTFDGSGFDKIKFQKTVMQISEQIDLVFKNIYIEDRLNLESRADLEVLNTNFTDVWKHSSKYVFEVLGIVRVKEILSHFSFKRVCSWSFDEFDFYQTLPDQLTIYRGGKDSAEDVLKGFSWTLDFSVANQFAKIHENGLVLRAEVNRDDLIFANPEEWEVVPRIGSIKNVSVIKDPNPGVTPSVKFREVIY